MLCRVGPLVPMCAEIQAGGEGCAEWLSFLMSCAVLRVRLRPAMSGRMGACLLLFAWDIY